MTHHHLAESRRSTPLWRICTAVYAIGVADFLAAFVLIFVAFALDSDALDGVALFMFLGAWPVLFVAAVLDVLRHR